MDFYALNNIALSDEIFSPRLTRAMEAADGYASAGEAANGALGRVIADALRAGQDGGDASGNAARDVTVVLELDNEAFARAVYKANGEEARRVGAVLSGGDG